MLDASVAINLLGTGAGAAILEATPAPALMEEHAFREIRRHPIPSRDHTEDLGAWQDSGLLTVASVFGEGKHIFEGPPGNGLVTQLDDGEAATIAYAVSEGKNTVPVIDERKATRLFKERWPDLQVIDTVTLVRSLVEIKTLSEDLARGAIHSALLHARMRVAPEMRAWVIGLIGPDLAAKCPSLGSYGRR